MAIIDPPIYSDYEHHLLETWAQGEAYRFYVETRRRLCNYRELLDLWLRVPLCEYCALSDPICRMRVPEIAPPGWVQDVEWALGEERLRRIRRQLRVDPDFALRCYRCATDLQPWYRDSVWVESYHLEEHFGIPVEAKGYRAARKMRSRVFELYGNACFGCGARRRLHLDHIYPRSWGGTAAFRNLQPLCERCGQEKGDALPEEVEVDSDHYFEPPPSDAFEGLFW